jgi:hypothetical protein
VSFETLLRSSHRARRRWRSARSGSWVPGPPAAVLDEFELALDGGDLARPSRTISCADVNGAWLSAVCGQMVGVAHLRLRRRLPVETVTVQQAREDIAAVKVACLKCPTLWHLLSSTSHVSAIPAGL